MASSNDVTQLVRRLQQADWEVSKNKHYKCRHPVNGNVVTISDTTSNITALRKIRADLRRASTESRRRAA